MMAKRGYGLSPCQNPPCIHLCVTLRHTDFIDDILRNLREVPFNPNPKRTVMTLVNPNPVNTQVVQEIRRDPTAAPKDGNAPIYGMASSLPGGPVKQLLAAYCDVVLAV